MSVCECKFCRTEGYLLYHGHEVCENHWSRHCDNADKFDLKKEFVDTSHGSGLTLEQGKVFLEMGGDILLCLDGGQQVLLLSKEYDEDTIDGRLARLIYDREWTLEVSKGGEVCDVL